MASMAVATRESILTEIAHEMEARGLPAFPHPAIWEHDPRRSTVIALHPGSPAYGGATDSDFMRFRCFGYDVVQDASLAVDGFEVRDR